MRIPNSKLILLAFNVRLSVDFSIDSDFKFNRVVSLSASETTTSGLCCSVFRFRYEGKMNPTPSKKAKKRKHIEGQTFMSFSSGNMEIRNDIPTSTCTSLEEEKITSSASRTFQENWKRDHFWLRYDSNKNAIFCRVCENANCKNIFATSGCQNFRTSS